MRLAQKQRIIMNLDSPDIILLVMKRLRRLVLLFGAAVYFISATPRVAAQSSFIRGVVTDEASLPVPNTRIELRCARTGHTTKIVSTSTRADGAFQLLTRLRGVCKVNIAAPGFSPVLILIRSSVNHAPVDLGTIRLRISCTGPGVVCDEVAPAKANPLVPSKPNAR